MITIDYMMKIRILALAVLAASLAGCGKTQKTMLDTAPVTVEDLSESVTATGTVESVHLGRCRHSGDRHYRQDLR